MRPADIETAGSEQLSERSDPQIDPLCAAAGTVAAGHAGTVTDRDGDSRNPARYRTGGQAAGTVTVRMAGSSDRRSSRSCVRNDSGAPLLELVVVMIVSGMLLSTVLTALLASSRLLAAAGPDSDPSVYGSVSAAVARLEASMASRQSCGNPPGARTREECLAVQTSGAITVIVDPVTGAAPGIAHPAGTPDTACWRVADPAVATVEKRRLECWELTAADVLAVTVHAHAETYPPGHPDAGTPVSGPDAADLLSIGVWDPSPESSRVVAVGVAALRWEPEIGMVRVCAAVRDLQRRLMNDEQVPFCDGSVGVDLPGGTARPTGGWDELEGFLLPPIQFGPGL